MTAAAWARGATGLVLAVSAWVRLSGVDLGWFMVDQARDVSEALRIAQGQRFPLVGPIAQGLYALGPLYYYLLAVPLWFRPAPEAAVAFLAFLNLGTVYLAYRIGREFFSPTVGLVAAALYGVFPMAIISARALWNPGFVPVFSVAFVYALFHFLVRGKAWGLTLALAALACLLQVHLSGLALGLVFLIALLCFRPAIPWRAALVGLGLAAGLYASYLAFEVQRGFQALPDALRFFGAQGQVVAHEPWIAMLWRAIRAPFTIPAHMAKGFLAVPTPAVIRPVQEIELALFVGGAIWLLATSLRRWRRTGAFPPAEGLLLLWIAIPLLTLTLKQQLLFWYYFDLLYPAQFLVIGLGIDRALGAMPWARLPRAAPRIAVALAVGGIGTIVAGQAWFLDRLGREVVTSGLFRLPTSVGLRARDPMWFIKERGYLDLMPLRHKRAITEALLAEAPMSRDAFFHRVHGAAFENLIEDNGQLHHLLEDDGQLHPRLEGRPAGGGAAPVAGETARGDHWLVLRAAEWPAGVRGVRRTVGPYWLARAAPATEGERWRCAPRPGAGWTGLRFDDSAWPGTAFPARAVPDLSVYAIPPLTAWGAMPLACRGWLAGETDPAALVVSLRTTPLPAHRVALEVFSLNGHEVRRSHTRSSLTAIHRHTEVVFDAMPSWRSGPNLVAFQVGGGTSTFDLDVYAVPRAGGTP